MLKAFKAHYADSTIAHIKARAADIGRIHEAKAQLSLAEADYRALVKAACKERSDSSADLDARERSRLLRALKARGYVETQALSARSQKIKANRLRDLGLIHKGQRELGLDDASYRKLVKQASAGKSRTSALLLAAERAKVLEEMKARGFDLEAA